MREYIRLSSPKVLPGRRYVTRLIHQQLQATNSNPKLFIAEDKQFYFKVIMYIAQSR